MKTKLLKKLRADAKARIGVFAQDNRKYRVVFDKTYFGDVSTYDEKSALYEGGYQILEKDVVDVKEAREMCDFYRRAFILQRVREKRYKNQERYY